MFIGCSVFFWLHLLLGSCWASRHLLAYDLISMGEQLFRKVCILSMVYTEECTCNSTANQVRGICQNSKNFDVFGA